MRQTARDMVAGLLRDEILSGELAPGVRLVAPEIAARYGISQTPVREAIQALHAEGLATISPYRDARVADLDPDECEEFYLMRDGLERHAARLGALNIDEEQLAEMKEHLRQMAVAAEVHDIDAFLLADRQFHRVHYDAAHRPRLAERITGLRYACERYTRLSYRMLPGEMELAIPRHAHLIDHLQEHDAESAAEWISTVLLSVPSRVRGLLAQSPE